MIKKKEVIVIAENDNQDLLYAWIKKNRDKLKFVSDDEGCGCCVSIFRIEGEESLLATFPEEIL